VPSDQGSGEIQTLQDGKWLASLDPLAQQVFEPNHWSHFRIRIENHSLLIRINEWELLRYDLSDVPLQVGIVGSDGTQQWRGIVGRDLGLSNNDLLNGAAK